MFGTEAFSSWVQIFLGATIFAFLFAAVVSMGEALFDGALALTRTSLEVGAIAFVGYVAVACSLRIERRAGKS